MGRLAVIGAATTVAGFGLVGALVLDADDDLAVRRAWDELPEDVEVVVLTPAAAAALADVPVARARALRVVMPS